VKLHRLEKNGTERGGENRGNWGRLHQGHRNRCPYPPSHSCELLIYLIDEGDSFQNFYLLTEAMLEVIYVTLSIQNVFSIEIK